MGWGRGDLGAPSDLDLIWWSRATVHTYAYNSRHGQVVIHISPFWRPQLSSIHINSAASYPSLPCCCFSLLLNRENDSFYIYFFFGIFIHHLIRWRGPAPILRRITRWLIDLIVYLPLPVAGARGPQLSKTGIRPRQRSVTSSSRSEATTSLPLPGRPVGLCWHLRWLGSRAEESTAESRERPQHRPSKPNLGRNETCVFASLLLLLSFSNNNNNNN